MFKNNRRSFIAFTLLLLLAVAGPALATHDATAAQTTQQGFALRSTDGRTISSEDVRGQVVVLAFGASWLPLSRKQAAGVSKLANEYAKQGVVVYFVATDSESPSSKNYASDEQLRAFAKRTELNVTVLRDPNGKFSKQLGIDQIPAFVILDKQGNVYGAPIGGMDSEGDVIGQLAPTLCKVL